MARLNIPKAVPSIFTHEGGKAVPVNAEQQLRRSVLACLLWEDQFYENGVSIADRIAQAAKQVETKFLADLAIEARTKYNLRHVPLLLLSVLSEVSKGTGLVAATIPKVISRADELAEFMVVLANHRGQTPDKLKKIMPHGVKRGLAAAFGKFDEYALAKYNREGPVKLRDVMFLTHPRPKDWAQKATWGQLIDGTLEAPDTWEVALSGGADKKTTFERLITEGKLGYFALLRNLRNMSQAGCDTSLVERAIRERKSGADRVLPFRFVAAARAAPQYEPALDDSLQQTIKTLPALKGRTLVLVDVSGSMDHQLSSKSDMRRIDAAAALASIINGDVRMFSFSNEVVEVPPRRGMAGVDALLSSQPHSGTYLGRALKELPVARDRLIVITDEQSADRLTAPEGLKYLINVASYQNGVGYRDGWIHLDGFSENIIRYIYELEASEGGRQHVDVDKSGAGV